MLAGRRSQAPIWEADLNTGGSCFNPDEPCVQGDVPLFAIAAENAGDISAAIRFATMYNIQLVVKSTGHDYNGRSTAANALMVWLHNFNGVTVEEAFAACDGDVPVPAVTALGGGTTWGQVYAALPAQYNVVGGSARTVSACGGYVSGGGHSWQVSTCMRHGAYRTQR